MNKHGGYRGTNQNMVDFSVNINPRGMPEGIRKTLIAGIADLVKYPEISGRSATQKIATDLNLTEQQVILGNGAIELIYLFARSMRPQKALIIQPTFNEYERALQLYGWNVIHHVLTEAQDFRIDPEVLKAVIEKENPQVVFLCNPNNPTGCVYKTAMLKELFEDSPKTITWFLDESFMDFSDEKGCLELIEAHGESIFILKSLTKFFALPGLRIGYGVGDPDTIKKMGDFKEPWTINTLALLAASAVYDEQGYIKKTKADVAQERRRVYQELGKIETIKVFESDADFHLCRLLNGDAAALQKDLEKHGMSLRTCEDFMGLNHSYFRISVKNEADNTKLLTFLKNRRI